MNSKWSKDYFVSLGERVGTTLIYGVITMLTADGSGAISGSAEQWWLVVGIPTALSLLKGLAANMSGGGPSAVGTEVVVQTAEGEHRAS